MPFLQYFPDPPIFWTIPQPQFQNQNTFIHDSTYVKTQMTDEINEVETKTGIPIKQRVGHIQKQIAHNQNHSKAKTQNQFTSYLSSSSQVNPKQTLSAQINKKSPNKNFIQTIVSNPEQELPKKCQFQIFKQNIPEKTLFADKSSKKTKYESLKVKTEDIKMQQEKGTKQANHWKRTIMPNMYQVIFAYLTRRQKSQHQVKKLFEKISKPNKKMSQNYSLQRYYQYQTLLRQKTVYCGNQQKFALLKQIHDPHCSNFQLQQQMYYNKLSRIVVRDFIEKELLGHLLRKQRGRHTGTEADNEFYLKHTQMYRRIKNVFKKTFTI